MPIDTLAWRRIGRRVLAVAVTVAITGPIVQLDGQWFNYPSPRAPRTASGAVDLSAATPRLANGKPDLSGMWMTAEPACVVRGVLPLAELVKLLPRTRTCPPRTASFSRQSVNMGIDMPGGLPYQPWLAKLVDERTANQSLDDPHIRCLPDLFVRAYGLPHYLKFIQTADLLVMLNEYNGVYRQVFTDGRPLPDDPNPSWQGYSSATWSGETLVIDTIGFRDDVWLDWAGSMITSAGKLREQIRRPDFGHLEIEVTVDDPKAYTRPWSVTLRQQFASDTELIDEICAEGERFASQLK
ncbi:MAG TPA: hypothetical protein VM846_16655 [Vicinamibacterales bacterium]|nr:hypothetical protein [Vicinamibacterales bacterium]